MVVVIDNKAEMANTQPNSYAHSSKGSDYSEPPPYVDLSPESSQAETPTQTSSAFEMSSNAEFLLTDVKPTNHLHINQAMTPISGKWKIDTGFKMPNYGGPGSGTNSKGKDRANLSLRTQVGTISATIELVGGPGRAQLVNIAYLGTISVRVSNPKNQKMDLYCQSSTGTISVYLPRNFRGPVTLKSDIGAKSVSKAVESNFAIFEKRGGVTKGFIGDYEGSGYGETENWEGDILFAQSSVGTVDVRYLDEWKGGILFAGRENSQDPETIPDSYPKAMAHV